MQSHRVLVAWLCCCVVALASFGQLQAPNAREFAGSLFPPKPSPSSERSKRKIARAKDLLEAGSKDHAIAILREVLRDEPENGDVHLLLGSALALVPERSEALKELQKAVELQPFSALAHFTLGTALARFGEPNAARRSFEKTLDLGPKFAEAHVSLAMILAQQHDLASAREHLIRSIQILGHTPSAAHSHYLLAQVLSEQNELEKAVEELNTATSLRPDYAEAFLALGLIRKQQLNNVAAIAAFKTAVALSPQNFEAQYELGAAYLRVDDPSQAVLHLRQAARLKPVDQSTLYQLCRALQRVGQAEEANACDQELSMKISTGVAAAGNELAATQANNAGVELEKEGNLAGALEKYHAALRLSPTRTVFRRNVALALCRLGRWDEGIAQLQEVLKEDPDDAEATKALYIALENARKAKISGNPSAKDQPE
jgi:tetratricopeptide (TPR) repeat protein